ncbi:Kelch repeat-containing protein [Flavivirga rizhaonensis]|uniref:Galactose oxidase n=1 Tax=Flavivirga rizhaonensis TaxID=2559571 RepID=A0A4S1DYI7_9FLAO|nr:kelch repeat-containing protein [Flavivirga rizhaonensis]TGV02612.1 galactose oxidase [Flavivirga rizhaonensis]
MSEKKSITIVLFLLILSCKGYKQGSSEPQKLWRQVAASDNSAPIARHEAAFVNVGDTFYLLGGRGIRSVSIFNTKTQKWTLGKKPPIEFHHFQPIVYQGNIYIIGALTGKYPTETPVEHVYIYNTNNDTWIKGDPIPKNRLRGSTGNIIKEEVVYISCGISNGHIGGHKKWLDSYNLKTGVWQVLPDAPRARDHFQAVENDDKIYVLAGRLSKAPDATFKETIAEVDVYDIKKKAWTTLEKGIPTKRAGNIALLYNDDVLVIGGESINQATAHSEVEALNTKNYTWRNYPPLIQGRHGTGAVLFNNEIYIASGCGNRGGSPELNTMEKY